MDPRLNKFGDLHDDTIHPSKLEFFVARFQLVRAQVHPRIASAKPLTRYLRLVVQLCAYRIYSDPNMYDMDPRSRQKQLAKLLQGILETEQNLRYRLYDSYFAMTTTRNPLKLAKNIRRFMRLLTHNHQQTMLPNVYRSHLEGELLERIMIESNRNELAAFIEGIVLPELLAESVRETTVLE